MSVKYKLLKYHGHFSTRSDFRAVTIENQVVGIERMGKNIQSASSLTQSDLIAAVAALKEEISFQLMSGNAVHLPGIGYFTLSVKGKLYQDPRSGHYRLRDPEPRTVKFRPDTEMMESLFHTEFENVTYRQGVSSIQPTRRLMRLSQCWELTGLSSLSTTCVSALTFRKQMLIALQHDWWKKER